MECVEAVALLFCYVSLFIAFYFWDKHHERRTTSNMRRQERSPWSDIDLRDLLKGEPEEVKLKIRQFNAYRETVRHVAEEDRWRLMAFLYAEGIDERRRTLREFEAGALAGDHARWLDRHLATLLPRNLDPDVTYQDIALEPIIHPPYGFEFQNLRAPLAEPLDEPEEHEHYH